MSVVRPVWANNEVAYLEAMARAAGVEPSPWYHIENAEDEATTTDVYLYAEIGLWGVTGADFVNALAEVTTDHITLHINSGGGSVWDGVTIMNAIRDHAAEVTVQVDALAASAASFIAMAGDTIVMNVASEMMIHNARAVCFGEAADMIAAAAFLERQNDKIANIYLNRAGGKLADWSAAMDAETWYSGPQAVKAGLADKALTAKKTKSEDADNIASRQERAKMVAALFTPTNESLEESLIIDQGENEDLAAKQEERTAALRAAFTNQKEYEHA